jgi:hypothetical protein
MTVDLLARRVPWIEGNMEDDDYFDVMDQLCDDADAEDARSDLECDLILSDLIAELRPKFSN